MTFNEDMRLELFSPLFITKFTIYNYFELKFCLLNVCIEQLIPGKESILTNLNRLFEKSEWVLAIKRFLPTLVEV